jgi:ankyrin repeat protein
LADRLCVEISLSGKVLDVEQIDDRRTIHLPDGIARAARDGNLIALRAKLDAGGDPDIRSQGYTPLHLAVIYGNADAALELIDRGADVHALDPSGHDALLLAATSNGISDSDAARVARTLLQRGVDVHRPRGDPLLGEYTPLFMADLRKKVMLIDVLKHFGRSV